MQAKADENWEQERTSRVIGNQGDHEKEKDYQNKQDQRDYNKQNSTNTQRNKVCHNELSYVRPFHCFGIITTIRHSFVYLSGRGFQGIIAGRALAVCRTGIWSHVRPSKTRPVLFLLTPPHCLKKKGVPFRIH